MHSFTTVSGEKGAITISETVFENEALHVPYHRQREPADQVFETSEQRLHMFLAVQ